MIRLTKKFELQPFARAVYKKPGQEGHDVDGYERKTFHKGEAALFTPRGGGKRVLAFRGTQSAYDAATDVGIVTKRKSVLGVKTPYGRRMGRMEKLAKKLVKKLGRNKLVMTGHSLGGHIAEKLACKFKVLATVFNKGAFFDKTCKEVTSLRQRGDMISLFGRGNTMVGKYDFDPLRAHGLHNFKAKNNVDVPVNASS